MLLRHGAKERAVTYKRSGPQPPGMRIPLAEVERIMRNAGAERISEAAIEELRDSAQEIAKEVAEDAVKAAADAGHDRVERSDVERAKEV